MLFKLHDFAYSKRTSDMSRYSSVVDVFKNIFRVYSIVSNQSMTKKISSKTTSIKLFPEQSEVSVLPTGCIIKGGKPSDMHTWMKSLTSTKPVMTKLQNLFVALVNMYIFQMTLKFSLFTVDYWCNFCYNITNTFLCMQTCRMFADVCSVCTIWISITLSLNLHMVVLSTPNNSYKLWSKRKLICLIITLANSSFHEHDTSNLSWFIRVFHNKIIVYILSPNLQA